MAKYGTNFSEQFEVFFVELSEGNPLFLTEALIDFEEKGRIKKKPSKKTENSEWDNDQEWELPTEFEFIKHFLETVEDIISRRVTRLTNSLRGLLEYASSQGNEFIMEAIPDIYQEPIEEMISTLKYEQCHDRKNAADVLYLIANISPPEKALEVLERSCSIAAQLHDVEFQIRCLQLLTEKYAESDFSHAEQCAQQVLQYQPILEKPCII